MLFWLLLTIVSPIWRTVLSATSRVYPLRTSIEARKTERILAGPARDDKSWSWRMAPADIDPSIFISSGFPRRGLPPIAKPLTGCQELFSVIDDETLIIQSSRRLLSICLPKSRSYAPLEISTSNRHIG